MVSMQTKRRRAPLAACALAGAMVGGLVVGDAVVPTESASAAPAQLATKLVKAAKKGKNQYGVGIGGYPVGSVISEQDVQNPKGYLQKLLGLVSSTPPVSVNDPNVMIVDDIADVSKQQAKRKTIVVSPVGQLLVNTAALYGATVFPRGDQGSSTQFSGHNAFGADAAEILEDAVEIAHHGRIKDAQRRIRTGMIQAGNGPAVPADVTTDAQNRITGISPVAPQLPANGRYGLRQYQYLRPGEQNARSIKIYPSSVRSQFLPENSYIGKDLPAAPGKHPYAFVKRSTGKTGVVLVNIYTAKSSTKWAPGPVLRKMLNWTPAEMNDASSFLKKNGTAVSSSKLQRPFRMVQGMYNGEMLRAILKDNEVVSMGPASNYHEFD